jgi:hypothetical protein
MKRKNLLKAFALAAVMLVSTNMFAQDGRFSVGAELAMPGGDYGDNAGTGFGASLRYEMPMGDNLGLTGTVGYLMYGKKSVETYGYKYEYSSSVIPIMLGAKYYFTEQQNGFYGAFQIGLSMLSNKSEYSYDLLGVHYSGSDTQSSSAFTWAPGVGYHLDNLDFGLNYYGFSYTQDYTTTVLGVAYTTEVTYAGSWIGIRAAYVFGGK